MDNSECYVRSISIVSH